MTNNKLSPISIHTTSLCLDVIYSPEFYYTETKDIIAMTEQVKQLIHNRCIDNKLYLDDIELISKKLAVKAVSILTNYQLTIQKLLPHEILQELQTCLDLALKTDKINQSGAKHQTPEALPIFSKIDWH
ncbi:MAG: hypothetical protein PHE38_09480 [Alishewanella agri]|nr:hypothetical protein [Alishewanella agri]